MQCAALIAPYALHYNDANGNTIVKRARRTDYAVADGSRQQRVRYLNTRYVYDALNREVTQHDPAGNTRRVVYNAYGEITAKGTGATAQEHFSYDNAGRLIQSNQKDGVERFYFYDANGNETLTLQSSGKTAHTLSGLTPRQVAALEQSQPVDFIKVENHYDSRNLRTRMETPGVDYKQYDRAAQRVTSVLSAGSPAPRIVNRNAYNAFGEVVAEIDGRAHALATSDNPWAQQERRALGYAAQAAQLTPSDQQILLERYTTRMRYTVQGQLAQTEEGLVAAVDERGQSQLLRPTNTFYYDLAGRLVGIKDANGNVSTKLLDANDLLRKEYSAQRDVAGGNYFREYRYDRLGNRRVLIDDRREP